MPLDPGREIARRFDVVDHRRAGLARQHVRGEQHELAIRVDDLAIACDHAEPIGVAVECQAELASIGAYARDQVLQVFGLRRIRMMVGKRAVDVAI